LQRAQAIAREVEAYLDYVSDYIIPYASLSEEQLSRINIPTAPERPPMLDTLEMVELYGLPIPGGWMNQPVEFMADLQAAKQGRWRHRRKETQKLNVRSLFYDAPGPEAF